MALITSADYPAVRSALDIRLDSTILPDSVIAQKTYHTAAELEVKRRDPDAESRTGDDLTRVQLATIYLLAAFLAPAVPYVTQQSLGGSSFSVHDVDWKERAAQLRTRADDLLAEVTDVTVFGHFDKAPGRRGVW